VPVSVTLLKGSLTFDGRATVGAFTGMTTQVTAALNLGSPLRTTKGFVEFAAASLRTNNERRDRDMRQSLEAERYPTIRLDIDGVDLPIDPDHPDARDSLIGFVTGRLTIHGVTRAVRLPIDIATQGDTLHVRSDFDIDLEEYKIGGLTRMFGLLKMEPVIRVHANLLFLAKEPLSLQSTP
jgi:polyisoprenoid-binding protein YceI